MQGLQSSRRAAPRLMLRCIAGCGMVGLLTTGGAAQEAAAPDTTKHHPARLNEITVTAAPARRADPAGSTSVPRALLLGSPALNPYDRLRVVAGLEVHDQGQGPGFASNASLRGFSSDHSSDLALWIDGVPINEPVNGHAEGYSDWSLIFPQAVRSIEIFNGPASPLYGNFAMAGAVSVRTIDRMQGTGAEVQGGAYGRAEATLLSGWDRGGSGGVVGLRGARESGWRPNSHNELVQGHLRAVHNLSSSSTIDAGIELYGAGWDSPGFLTTEQFDAADYAHVSNATDGGFKRRAQERASLQTLAGSALWRSTIFATQGRWQLFLTTPPEGGLTEGSQSQLEEEDRRFGFGATSAITWAGSRGDLSLGAESRWDHTSYQSWFVTDRARDSAEALIGAGQASGALFLQSAGQLTPWLRVSLGGRLDARHTWAAPEGEHRLSDTRALVSPKLGALLRLTRHLDLYGNVSRGFRQTDGVIRDPELPYITAWSYETGVKLARDGLALSAALFRMELSNEQTFDPLTGTSVAGGASRRQGLELSGRVDLGAFAKLLSNWTFVDARYRRFRTPEGETLTGVRVFNTARYVGSAVLALALPRARWHFQVAGNVLGSYSPFDAAGETRAPYGLVHLSGGIRLGAVEVELGVHNLLSHRYAELQAARFVVPGQPRTLFLALRHGMDTR